MKNMTKKRILSILLIAVLLIGIIPASVFAGEAEIIVTADGKACEVTRTTGDIPVYYVAIPENTTMKAELTGKTLENAVVWEYGIATSGSQFEITGTKLNEQKTLSDPERAIYGVTAQDSANKLLKIDIAYYEGSEIAYEILVVEVLPPVWNSDSLTVESATKTYDVTFLSGPFKAFYVAIDEDDTVTVDLVNKELAYAWGTDYYDLVTSGSTFEVSGETLRLDGFTDPLIGIIDIPSYGVTMQNPENRIVKLSIGYMVSAFSVENVYLFVELVPAPTEEELLAQAKDDAKAELAGYADEDDYRDAEKAELEAAVEAGNDAIDAAETQEAVADALAAAKSAIDEIPTDAELTAQEEAEAAAALAQAKDDAIAELEGYVNEEDYRDAEKEELAAIIETATDAINEAETAEEVEALLDAAKAEMDAVKTDAQLKAEEAAQAPEDTAKPNPATGDKAGGIISGICTMLFTAMGMFIRRKNIMA